MMIEGIASEITKSLFKGSFRRRISEQTKKNSFDAKSVGIIDTNLGFDHAYRLAEDGLEVYYHIPVGNPYPYLHEDISGDGFDKIIKINDREELIKKSDFIIFTDCFFGKDADSMRKDGKIVFGPSNEWSRIENERVYGWNALKKMKVGVPDGVIKHGYQECLDYIEKNQDGEKVFYPKLNRHRGNGETRSVMNKTDALVMLSQLGIGPYLTDLEILIQLGCPGFEIGLDIFFDGKNFLRPFLFTCEEKGSGTVGVITETNGVDELLLDKVKPSLIESNYRGNISFEFFYDGKEIYVHDPCARMAFPCSALQAHFIKNYAEVLYSVAIGKGVPVKFKSKKYIAQIGIYTDDKQTYRPIHFPEDLRDKIGFRRVVIREGEYYFVPGDFLVATAMGEGDSPDEAMEEALDIGMQIECSNSSPANNFVGITKEKIKKLNSLKGNIDMEF